MKSKIHQSLYALMPLFLVLLVHSCKEPANSDLNEKEWLQKGDSLTKQTFDTLRNTLMRAIAENGTAGAVQFCNTRATELTSTYANATVSIRRTSERYRNPANAPDSLEFSYLKQYVSLAAADAKPILVADDAGMIHYFKPIYTQTLCLNCHGVKDQQIQPETWTAIQAAYPNDRAFDYKEKEFRGMWHLVFQK